MLPMILGPTKLGNKKGKSASIAVTVMSAVAVAAHGNKPKTFMKVIDMNIVNRYGTYLLYFSLLY